MLSLLTLSGVILDMLLWRNVFALLTLNWWRTQTGLPLEFMHSISVIVHIPSSAATASTSDITQSSRDFKHNIPGPNIYREKMEAKMWQHSTKEVWRGMKWLQQVCLWSSGGPRILLLSWTYSSVGSTQPPPLISAPIHTSAVVSGLLPSMGTIKDAAMPPSLSSTMTLKDLHSSPSSPPPITYMSLDGVASPPPSSSMICQPLLASFLL